MEDKVQQHIIAINNKVGDIVAHECANITTRIQVMLHELLKTYQGEVDKLKVEVDKLKVEVDKLKVEVEVAKGDLDCAIDLHKVAIDELEEANEESLRELGDLQESIS